MLFMSNSNSETGYRHSVSKFPQKSDKNVAYFGMATMGAVIIGILVGIYIVLLRITWRSAMNDNYEGGE
jgi:hypothetical protein